MIFRYRVSTHVAGAASLARIAIFAGQRQLAVDTLGPFQNRGQAMLAAWARVRKFERDMAAPFVSTNPLDTTH